MNMPDYAPGRRFTQTFVSDYQEMKKELETIKKLGWLVHSVSGDKTHGWVITAVKPPQAA